MSYTTKDKLISTHLLNDHGHLILEASLYYYEKFSINLAVELGHISSLLYIHLFFYDGSNMIMINFY